MNFFMSWQIRFLGKMLATILAFKWLFSSMDPFMYFQMIWSIKTFGTILFAICGCTIAYLNVVSGVVEVNVRVQECSALQSTSQTQHRSRRPVRVDGTTLYTWPVQSNYSPAPTCTNYCTLFYNDPNCLEQRLPGIFSLQPPQPFTGRWIESQIPYHSYPNNVFIILYCMYTP